MNSIAKSLIRLEPCQNISLLYFDVETEYQNTRANLNFEGSYQYAKERKDVREDRDLRVFNVTIPVMRYYFGSQGQVLIDYERPTNLAWLEWMFNIHKLVKAFIFDHPIYGSIKVRFAEPFKIPQGIKGGNSAVASIEVRLVEVIDKHTAATHYLGPHFFLNLSGSYWGEHKLFDFPYHTVSTEYNSEDTVIQLGGNYSYTVRGSKPEERVFNLQFEGLQYTETGLYIIGTEAEDLQLSMQYLENFYYWYRLDKSFYYYHPRYGKLLVRFKEPLKIPKLRANGNGWTENFTITLVEVIEDAKRYV